MVIKGQITEIITQKEDDWGIYKVEDDLGRQTVLVGTIPFASYGMRVEVTGSEEYSRWGGQVKIEEVISTTPNRTAGIKQFLIDNIYAVGPKRAEKIIKNFGEKSLDMFDSDEGLAQLVAKKCITKASVSAVRDNFNSCRDLAELTVFFRGALSKLIIKKLIDHYGTSENVKKAYEKDPYCLYTEMDGFGFKKTDTLARMMGVKTTAAPRVKAGLTYVLETAANEGGDCYLPYDEFKGRSIQLLGAMPKFSDISEMVAENAAAQWSSDRKEKLIKAYDPCSETLDGIEMIVEIRKYLTEEFDKVFTQAIEDERIVEDCGRIYSKKMYDTEMSLGSNIAQMVKMRPTFTISDADIEDVIDKTEADGKSAQMARGEFPDFKLEEEQKQAVRNALKHRISVMTGGPGTGKTTTIQTIAKGFLSQGRHTKDQVMMVAPTGRAAQRIKEQTGYNSSTIHRAIFEYDHGEQKLKDAPHGLLIICDEFSMVDVKLAASLLQYARYSNLVIVGDVDQIASVGPGKVLKDIITSGAVPTVFLKLGHRNAGSIARNAVRINKGIRISGYEYDDHFHYWGTIDKTQMPVKIMNDYIRNVNRYGIQEVMLAVAMKSRGILCVDALNKSLQQIFTGKNDSVAFNKAKVFNLGDRVMQTKNDYNFKRAYPDGKSDAKVFNGEKGIVIKIVHASQAKDFEDHLIVKYDDGTYGAYDKDNIKNLTLAYATTIHKCQGSEAKCMMMAYTFGDYMLLRRSLFYTGETRAKEEFYFYGEEKTGEYGNYNAFDSAVGKLDDKERYTGLSVMLKNFTKENERVF